MHDNGPVECVYYTVLLMQTGSSSIVLPWLVSVELIVNYFRDNDYDT